MIYNFLEIFDKKRINALFIPQFLYILILFFMKIYAKVTISIVFYFAVIAFQIFSTKTAQLAFPSTKNLCRIFQKCRNVQFSYTTILFISFICFWAFNFSRVNSRKWNVFLTLLHSNSFNSFLVSCIHMFSNRYECAFYQKTADGRQRQNFSFHTWMFRTANPWNKWSQSGEQDARLFKF